MAKRNHGLARRHLDVLFNEGTLGGMTDAHLLELFTSGRDETAELAFAVLVERHGPMVLRVCRAVLRDSHDTNDAFQATFLILVRAGRLALGARVVGTLAASGGPSHRVPRPIGCGAAETTRAARGGIGGDCLPTMVIVTTSSGWSKRR